MHKKPPCKNLFSELMNLIVFRRVGLVVKSTYLLRYVRPSDRISAAPTLDELVTFYTRTFIKICLKTPNFLKIGQKYRTVFKKNARRFVVAFDINLP
jgi:hypothetical protein